MSNMQQNFGVGISPDHPQNFGVGALLDDLLPYITDMVAEAIDAALTRFAIPTLLPATVVSVDASSGIVTVQPDGGGGVTITVKSLIGSVSSGMRVMLLLQPPSGAFIIGVIDVFTRAYTPAFESTGAAPVMTASNRKGRYTRWGGWIFAQAHWKWSALGAGEGLGTGTYSFGLPVACSGIYIAAESVIGPAEYTQTGVRGWVGVAQLTSTSRVQLWMDNNNKCGAAIPAVPVNGDSYTMSVMYESAA